MGLKFAHPISNEGLFCYYQHSIYISFVEPIQQEVNGNLGLPQSLLMENGGIWLAPSWETTGIAVVLCVLVSIATVLSGPPLQDLEDDDYEFDQEL